AAHLPKYETERDDDRSRQGVSERVGPCILPVIAAFGQGAEAENCVVARVPDRTGRVEHLPERGGGAGGRVLDRRAGEVDGRRLPLGRHPATLFFVAQQALVMVFMSPDGTTIVEDVIAQMLEETIALEVADSVGAGASGPLFQLLLVDPLRLPIDVRDGKTLSPRTARLLELCKVIHGCSHSGEEWVAAHAGGRVHLLRVLDQLIQTDTERLIFEDLGDNPVMLAHPCRIDFG